MSATLKRIPRETEVEEVFGKILQSPEACGRLEEIFYDRFSEENISPDTRSQHFAKALFSAYENQDISALLLEICQRSMFDLLREAYLIPKRFHGKAGDNPVLLTDVDGNKLKTENRKISSHEWNKYQEILKNHVCAPRSKIYLADGYDIVRRYTDDLDIKEDYVNPKRGIFILYALPDTAALGMSEAQAYAIIWDAFQQIQKCALSAMVYYGQETGLKNERKFDEIGVLLPISQFEKKILHHLTEIDGIVLASREELMKKAGKDSLEL